MATLEQIGIALKRAAAAGDTAAAAKLAAAYKAAQAQQAGQSAQMPQQTYQIDTGNPMQQGTPAAPSGPPQSIGDQLSAGFTSGVNAIPIAGPTILGGLEHLKGMVQGRSPQDVAATDQAQVQQNPGASLTGAIAGNVLPFAVNGAEVRSISTWPR